MVLIWYLCYKPDAVLIAFFLDLSVPLISCLHSHPVPFYIYHSTLLSYQGTLYWPNCLQWFSNCFAKITGTVYEYETPYALRIPLLVCNEASMFWLWTKTAMASVYLLAIVSSFSRLTRAAWFLTIWSNNFQIAIQTTPLTQSGRLNMIWPWTNTATASVIKARCCDYYVCENPFCLLKSLRQQISLIRTVILCAV